MGSAQILIVLTQPGSLLTMDARIEGCCVSETTQNPITILYYDDRVSHVATFQELLGPLQPDQDQSFFSGLGSLATWWCVHGRAWVLQRGLDLLVTMAFAGSQNLNATIAAAIFSMKAQSNTGHSVTESQEVLMTGWLWKSVNGAWGKRKMERFYVLLGPENPKLQYYHSENDFQAGEPCKREYDLEGCSLKCTRKPNKTSKTIGIFHPLRGQVR